MFNLSAHGPIPHLMWIASCLRFGADIMAFIFSRGAKIAVIVKVWIASAFVSALT